MECGPVYVRGDLFIKGLQSSIQATSTSSDSWQRAANLAQECKTILMMNFSPIVKMPVFSIFLPIHSRLEPDYSASENVERLITTEFGPSAPDVTAGILGRLVLPVIEEVFGTWMSFDPHSPIAGIQTSQDRGVSVAMDGLILERDVA